MKEFKSQRQLQIDQISTRGNCKTPRRWKIEDADSFVIASLGRRTAFLFLFLIFLTALFAFLLYKATTPEMPSPSTPVVFYATQSRQDLKLLFCKAIRNAEHSLYASFYGITDRDIISLLSKKCASGINISIDYDPRASVSLHNFFPISAMLSPKKGKGLMHRKILSIDNAFVFLGSANWTSSSLRHHSNFVIGMHAPRLAQFLSRPNASHLSLSLSEAQHAECHLLPDKEKRAFHHLLSLIQGAKKTIRIAMFTFTHPQIAQALIDAMHRGVKVRIVVDYYSGRGASKKLVEQLSKEGIIVFLSQGQQLLHHKWAIFDNTIFVMGSANWTKAAFSKNEDFLFTLSPLTPPQQKFLNDLWSAIELEGTCNSL